MLQKIKALINSVIQTTLDIEIESPKNEQYGDYSTNIAIVMSKINGSRPMEVANDLMAGLIKADKAICVAGPGFINFKIAESVLQNNLKDIIRHNDKYGQSGSCRKEKVLLEYVSANPTGPLHIGHGRWAVIGDCLANVLKATGKRVDREYYVNDVGEQINKLEGSLKASIEGRPIPEGGYAGGYIAELANELKGKKNLRDEAVKYLLSQQKSTLKRLGVEYDIWFSESRLHNSGKVMKCVKKLQDKGLTFREGSALCRPGRPCIP